jgi:hypothetical protein
MAVFLAASDETSGANAFGLYHYAGWLAPEPDWYRFFAPAWQERVLDGPPTIPYLHMTQMRGWRWRAQVGISDANMNDRLDEAARVIDTLGSLYPFKITIDAGVFRPLYKPHKMLVGSGGQKDHQPDFLAFTSYAYAVLLYVHTHYPDTEKVDFLVENNSEITKHVHELFGSLPDSLNYIGQPELVPLIGGFSAAGKEHAPLQAADYLCWHIQRANLQKLDDRDYRRWNTIWTLRERFDFDVPTDILTAIAEAFTEREKEEDEKVCRIRSIRQNDAHCNERAARLNRKGTGRRKGS